MNRGLALVAGLGLVALAFGVSATTPTQRAVEQPFATPAVLGEEAVSRHLLVTVHDVALADVIVLDAWTGTTSGVWLVGEATVTATTERRTLRVEGFLGDTRYIETRRPRRGLLSSGVVEAGFPITGPFAIELPADVLDRPEATGFVVRFGAGLDSRLDGVVELRVDLTALDHERRLVLDVVREGER